MMGATVGVGLVGATLGYALVDQPADGLRKATVAAGLIGAFGGMCVMFTASLLNLRRLRPHAYGMAHHRHGDTITC